MTVRFWARLGLAVLGIGSAGVGSAQETGLSDMHEQRREGGRTCMIDHFHSGSSSGMPTRKQAEVAAIRDWAGFTALEYGPPWGRYALAGSKSMRCAKEGNSWGCTVDARPCKAGRGR